MCIADYWDEDTIGKVIELIHEYQELFPTKFMKLKGHHGRPGRHENQFKAICEPCKTTTIQTQHKVKGEGKGGT